MSPPDAEGSEVWDARGGRRRSKVCSPAGRAFSRHGLVLSLLGCGLGCLGVGCETVVPGDRASLGDIAASGSGVGGNGVSGLGGQGDFTGGGGGVPAFTAGTSGDIGHGGAGGGEAGSGGSAGEVPDMLPPPCMKQTSQVVLLGDSYVDWVTHTLPEDLAQRSGQSWRVYAAGGSSMGSNGLSGSIPEQFEQAIADDPDIIAVVMNGGGNDVLLPGWQFTGADQCRDSENSPNIQVCRDIVDMAIQRAMQLMDRAVAVGVRDVLYFFYPEVPEGTILGGLKPNAILNYALPLARDACESAFERTQGQLRCHFVDMIPVFAGNPHYFAFWDVHPSTDGSAAMADVIWARMQQVCMAQPASSGCCEP